MRSFEFHKADTPHTAIALMAAHPQAKLLAGGTTLLDLMKLSVETPTAVIDINDIGLDQIESAFDGTIRIGAMARNSDVAAHEEIRARFPALSQAILLGASQQIRNMASVGGNILQRTWCAYFRDATYPCNKREPGSGCAALTGHARGNAVLGGSDDCFATHPTDMGVALAAFDAVVFTRGPDGAERAIPFVDFHRLPGDAPHLETTLRTGELITRIDVPALPFGRASKYRKVRDRTSYQHALASAAVALDVDRATGRIRDARVALGGVTVKPWRSREAEAALKGAPAADATYDTAAEAALADAIPRGDTEFKINLAKRTLARTLADVAGMA